MSMITDALLAELSEQEKTYWDKYEDLLKYFRDQWALAQKYALDLGNQIQNTLKETLSEGLSVPARGAAFTVNTFGEAVNFIGEGLAHITNAAKAISKIGLYLSKGYQSGAEVSSAIMSYVDPAVQVSADGLIAVADKLKSYSEENLKEYPKLQGTLKLFSSTFNAFGYTLKGLSGLFTGLSDLSSKLIAPALEQISSGSNRLMEGLHSVTESVREFCQGVHVRCENAAKVINFKPESEANKKLDQFASATAAKAKSFLWSFTTPKETNTEVEESTPSEKQRLSKKS